MAAIPLQRFLEFARSLEGEVIATRAGRSRFTLRVLDSGLEFTPISTGKPRRHRLSFVERVLDRFTQTGSWSTSSYRFTVNASYQLALIDRYLAAQREQSL